MSHSHASADDALIAKHGDGKASTSPHTVISVAPYNSCVSPPAPPAATPASVVAPLILPHAHTLPAGGHREYPYTPGGGNESTVNATPNGSLTGERSRARSSISHIFDDALSDRVEDFIHEERKCCCCNFACGRCLSHCWFLTACCGFILLSSLPRFLTILDFVVTVLIYSLSFAGQSSPSLSFWEFLRHDFENYEFNRSGGSLVILAFARMCTLFFVFAYRFHLKPAAFVAASCVAATSVLFIIVKFMLNENEHLLTLLIWSLAITCLEYVAWLALRRHRIKKPVIDESHLHVLEEAQAAAEAEAAAAGLYTAPAGQPLTMASPGRHIALPQSHSKQQAYHRLDSDEDPRDRPHSVTTGGAASTLGGGSSFVSASPSFLGTSSFTGPSSLGGLMGSRVGSPSMFSKGPLSDQELEPSTLADPDSLFVEIDALQVHYKLSVNGRPVLAGAPGVAQAVGVFGGAGGNETTSFTGSASSASSTSASALRRSLEDGPIFPVSATVPTAPTSPVASFYHSAADATSSAFGASHPEAATFTAPLVLMHGFGSSLFQFRAMWRDLSQHAPIVLAFDRPGFGLTTRPIKDSAGSFGTYLDRSGASAAGGRGVMMEQENPYTQEYAVTLLLKLMAKLGLTSHRSVLVAHSTGGSIALRAAICSPKLFLGVFLISPHLFTFGFPAMLKSLLKTKLGKLITQQLVRSELGEVALKRAWFDAGHIPTDALANYQRTLRIKGQMEALIEIAANAPEERDPWAKLSLHLHELAGTEPNSTDPAKHGTPVCIIHGIQDKLLDVSESVKAYKQMTAEGVNCTLIKIDHCGHVPHEEFPSLTLGHLFGFLRMLESEQHERQQHRQATQ